MNIVKRILDDRPNAQNVALRKSLSHIDKSTELKPTSDGIPQMYQQNLPQMQTSLFSDIELTSQVNDGVPIIKYTNNFCLDPKKRYALLEVTNIVLSSGITAFSNMLGHLMSAGSPRYSFWQNCDLLHEKISDSSCTNVFLTFGVNIFLDALYQVCPIHF